MKLKDRLGKHPVLIITTICVICVAVIAGFTAHIELQRYEDGILDVCAAQQDAYVQLVLDQINLKDNRNDEQIIKEILETMDASSNHYWTFTKDQTMLFVKDITETNKYKGVTASTYYMSDSAKEFIDGLIQNKVVHKTININDNDYIASGVLFEYKNEPYRLCLLTQRGALLDNNSYLGVKTQMTTLFVVLLLIIVLVPMLMAYYIRHMLFKKDVQKDTIDTVNRRLSKINQKLMESDLHDTRNNLWKQKAIIPFLEKITKREIYPVTFIHIKCRNIESRVKFIERAVYILDKNVLRFEYGRADLVLIFIKIDEKRALDKINILVDDNSSVENSQLVNNEADISKLKDRYKQSKAV